jgi:hypothetical protein
MKKNQVLFLVVLFFGYACAPPEKEKIITSDTVSRDSANDSVPKIPQTIEVKNDSSIKDSSISEARFDKNDSLSYFILSNYVASDEIKPAPSEIQAIKSACAVLVYPTDEQIQAMKKEYGDNFDTIAGDNGYYHGLAIEMLDSIDIETVNAEKRFLLFKSKSNSWTLDIRKEGAPAWNLVFFSLQKKPLIVPITDLSHNKIIEYFDAKSE